MELRRERDDDLTSRKIRRMKAFKLNNPRLTSKAFFISEGIHTVFSIFFENEPGSSPKELGRIG